MNRKRGNKLAAGALAALMLTGSIAGAANVTSTSSDTAAAQVKPWYQSWLSAWWQSQTKTVEMTDTVEVNGVTYYYAEGKATNTFTVNGKKVRATAVDAQGTVFKYSENALKGTLYGTANVPYADYYYGEMNRVYDTLNTTIYSGALPESKTMKTYRSEGYYDVMSSATAQKSARFTETTYIQANDKGGNDILGVQATVAVRADLYANAVILDAMGKSNNTIALATSLTNLTTEKPDSYKVLNAGGTLSATKGARTVVKNTESEFTSETAWGDFQLDIDTDQYVEAIGETGSDVVLGAVVTTTDGSQYAMLHEENIWLQRQELAWSVGYKTTEPHGNTLRYAPYVSMQGKTMASVT
ncbi:MAG: hypothetical protein ACI4PQ_05785 [Butyricicoccaceae bacterium]